jgi:hypothetical protein
MRGELAVLLLAAVGAPLATCLEEQQLDVTSLCQNTRLGRLYLADSTGRVCPRASFLSSTGCCDTSDDASKRLSCETCEPELDGCCSSYEHCVSCCMRPENYGDADLSTLTEEVFRDKPFVFDSAFAFCEAACRTTSSSTVHENAFIGARRYCFRYNAGRFKRPKLDDGEFTDLEGSSGDGRVQVVVGAEGKSCTEACQSLQPPMTCEDSSPYSSSCDEMREFFPCEAGCWEHDSGVVARSPAQETHPSYISPWGPKPDWPAGCFPDAALTSGCEAKVVHVQRLCQCHGQL